MKSITMISVVLVVSVIAACKGPGTHLVVPTPPHARYVAVNAAALHAVSATDVWVAGDLTTENGTPEGLLLVTQDGGQRWRRVASEIHDLSNLTFTAICFTDRLRGWVAGRRTTPSGTHRGVVFRTTDGGNHWSEVVLPAGEGVVIDDIHSLLFTTDSDGDVLVSYRDAGAAEAKESVFHTTDGGKLWTVTSFQAEPAAKVQDRTVSWLGAAKSNGFRLRKPDRAGVTLLEVTASGGKDWMPASELSLSYIPTFY